MLSLRMGDGEMSAVCFFELTDGAMIGREDSNEVGILTAICGFLFKIIAQVRESRICLE